MERERIEERDRNQFPRDLRDDGYDDGGDSRTNFCAHGKRMDSVERNIFCDDPLLLLYPAERTKERREDRERGTENGVFDDVTASVRRT